MKLIIDGAQSFGSTYHSKTDSCLGDISTTGTTKPLGATVMVSNILIMKYARKIKFYVHGQIKYHRKYLGLGGRLDTIQASILLTKFLLSSELLDRRKIAQKYTSSVQKHQNTSS